MVRRLTARTGTCTCGCLSMALARRCCVIRVRARSRPVVLCAAGLDRGTVAVDVLGGRLTISLDGDVCWLACPAVIVATGAVSVPQLAVA